MAKDTNRRINANLESPKFRKLLEEAKLMVQQGKKKDGAYHILKHMDLKKDENDLFLHWHIPDRQLAEMIGVGNTTVSDARRYLIQENSGKEKVIKNVDTSNVKCIGSGSESVYLYYFPIYQLYAKLTGSTNWPCNIGKTIGDVKDRVSDQIGQQLPEKPKIALIIRTDDCEALETEIHDELKRRRCWLNPKSGADVVGVEWFLTNPAEVEGTFKSIHKTENSNE